MTLSREGSKSRKIAFLVATSSRGSVLDQFKSENTRRNKGRDTNDSTGRFSDQPHPALHSLSVSLAGDLFMSMPFSSWP
jgi:hypothetical protein